jgi:hypothetical protein
MFGIEDFCRKLNGNCTLHELLHLNIAAGERRSFAGFDPHSDGGYEPFHAPPTPLHKPHHAIYACDSANYSPGLALTGPGRQSFGRAPRRAALLFRFRA